MKKKDTALVAAGILAGTLLGAPGVRAAETLAALPSAQSFYVDGQRVSLTAYAIEGHNYVMLRDIGRAAGFRVDYDSAANSVLVDTSRPYQEETTGYSVAEGGIAVTGTSWSREDFSQRANPAVFTGALTRELYNTLRQTILDGGAGAQPAFCMVSAQDYGAVSSLLGRLDSGALYRHFVPGNLRNYWQYPNYFAVEIEQAPGYQQALDFIQPVLNRTNQMSDREKAAYLHDYLCTLMRCQADASAGLVQTFSQHKEEVAGACGSYARNFSFLCKEAGLPCFTVHSGSHVWNLVYADGAWLHVDVSADDLNRSRSALLRESCLSDPAPEETEFLKELLVPGSTT